VFTGLVREVGTVLSRVGSDGGLRVTIAAPLTAPSAEPGDSIAVDGVCLTVVARDETTLTFEAVPETLARTTLAGVERGARVNLEPALRVGDQLGGHLVQGHVDGVGAVRSVEPEGDGRRLWVNASPELSRYLAVKGSVAVDGTSLTVASLDEAGFAVALVPHTLAATTLGALGAGDAVNLEVDVLAKYVERLMRGED